MLIRPGNWSLVVIDVQQRLLPAMANAKGVVTEIERLMRAARLAEAPVTVSEQYPSGLGPTVEPLRSLVRDHEVIAKLGFSCATEPRFCERLCHGDIVLAGVEAHVCVLQTALEFRELGKPVFVVADAVTSRSPESASLALERMRHAGVSVVSAEMVLFEIMRTAAHPSFAAISALVRGPRAAKRRQAGAGGKAGAASRRAGAQ